MLAHVAFFPEQIAGQVVEGMGGDEILVHGRIRAKDGHKGKGDLEQWKVLLLICNSFQESFSSGSFPCPGSNHVGGVLPPPPGS